MLKLSTRNIADWWFAADTPIRRYKFQVNPQLQRACEQVGRQFVAPSGATDTMHYRPADKRAFAQAVQRAFSEETIH